MPVQISRSPSRAPFPNAATTVFSSLSEAIASLPTPTLTTPSHPCTPYMLTSRPTEMSLATQVPLQDYFPLQRFEQLERRPHVGMSSRRLSQDMDDTRDLVLVTGGAGYIPTHSILPILTANQYGVILLDNFCNSLPEAISRIRLLAELECDKLGIPGNNRPPIYSEECDIRDRESLENCLEKYRRTNGQSRIVSCLHFAALKSISESLKRPREYYEVNVTGTLNLVEALEKVGCKKLVFSSSVVVYGKMEGLGQNVRLKEEMRTVGRPGGEINNPYGRSKLLCEEILNDICNADADWKIVILRYANPSGCHPSGFIGENPLQATNLMPTVSLVLQGRKPCVKIFGTRFDTPDGTGVRDFCHVMDIAEAHFSALNLLSSSRMSTGSNCRTYNLGTGVGVSVLEIIETLSTISRSPIKTVLEAPRSGDLPSVVCDPSKAERELGWRAKRSLVDMCRDQWTWVEKNPMGYEV